MRTRPLAYLAIVSLLVPLAACDLQGEAPLDGEEWASLVASGTPADGHRGAAPAPDPDPEPEPLPTIAWDIGRSEVVVSDEERRANGLDQWIDGNIGFVELDGVVRGFAANGPQSAQWTVGSDRLVEDVLETRMDIVGLPDDVRHAAGGPVHLDEASGALFMLYHGEQYPGGVVSTADFWSFVGMAVSVDRGATFTDRGPVITPHVAIDDPARTFAVEVGGAPFVVGDDGNMYVYFRDVVVEEGDHVSALNLSVARASLDELVADGLAGRATAWHKFDGEGWSEPGVGGKGAEIMAGAPHPNWFDVAYLADSDLYVLVASHGGGVQWQVWGSVSRDGLTWTQPQTLFADPEGTESLYVSLSSPDLRSQRVVHGDVVHLYRTRSTVAEGSRTRWDGEVTIERTELRLGVG
ncbi:MAG: hypothetical protein JJU45_02655 [Acidimicrobiia bacterium]|nr:hypothetical protein [Acidimicrobiia bacterium]